MADLNSLENLSGPVGAPAPLGQAPTSGITPGVVNPGFDEVAQALTQGGGTVNPAIGSGNNQTVTGGSGMGAVSGLAGAGSLSGVGPGGNVAGNLTGQQAEPMFIPDRELTGEELTSEEFGDAYATGGKKGLRQSTRLDRQTDRQDRKAKGLKGKEKRQERRSQRQSRKRSKWDAKTA